MLTQKIIKLRPDPVSFEALNAKLDVLSSEVSMMKEQLKFLRIRTSDGKKYVSIDSILYIKSSSNYSTIYLTQGSIFTSKTLKHWANAIAGKSFVRVHSSLLINQTAVTSKLNKDGLDTYTFFNDTTCTCNSRSIFKKTFL